MQALQYRRSLKHQFHPFSTFQEMSSMSTRVKNKEPQETVIVILMHLRWLHTLQRNPICPWIWLSSLYAPFQLLLVPRWPADISSLWSLEREFWCSAFFGLHGILPLYCYKDLNAFDGVVCIQIMTGAVGLLGARGGMGGLGGAYQGIIGSIWLSGFDSEKESKRKGDLDKTKRKRMEKGRLFCLPCLFNFLHVYRLVWNLQVGSYLLCLSPVYQCFPLGSWWALSAFVLYCFCPRPFFPRSFVCLPICYCHMFIVF